MKLTHPTIKVANQVFDVPTSLIKEGQVKFNEEGIANVSQALGEYMISAGFELIKEKKETPAPKETVLEAPQVEQPEAPETKPEVEVKADKKSKKGKEKPQINTAPEEPKE